MEAPPTASERRQEEEEEEGDDDGGEEGPTNKMARRFTSDENGALVDEVLARWDVLFGSRSHRISAARRQHHWQQVTDKVNTVGALHRDRPTVYKRFSDLKRWLRAKLVTRRAKAQKTGGGRVPPLRLKPYERRLLDILSKEGSEGVDTDWRIPPQTSRPDSSSDQDQDDAAQQPQEEGEAEDRDRAPEAQEHRAESRAQSPAVIPVVPPRRRAAATAAAAAIGGPPQEEGRRLGEQPAAQPGLVDAMMAAMQPMLHQQRRQELWMRRWMALIHRDIQETQVTIHRGIQDLVAAMAAQPHRPGGSAEGEVPGPPAAPPPPP
ncbi:myb-related transcription factor, partner of profilin-like isoform X2 [Xenopus laevis]|uniref:Myb-related transcription factor, partner of profilin-like isoform X2 n=1 Tax=Xenopus laevis TaxID=8355 RepID=A0A8J1KU17_XENLA|nr:myb-related transcription factor, partner of profilin-like isoform X2 [Xenopus laevis]XP_041430973.1 myb-related transcription factor, partner of profilin-like isoform X2 [Xenopus laevis]